jgi:hypothetical protein
LIAIANYQTTAQNKDVALVTAAFPLMLFSFAWITAILAVIFSSAGFCSYCVYITFFAIMATLILAYSGLFGYSRELKSGFWDFILRRKK